MMKESNFSFLLYEHSDQDITSIYVSGQMIGVIKDGIFAPDEKLPMRLPPGIKSIAELQFLLIGKLSALKNLPPILQSDTTLIAG